MFVSKISWRSSDKLEANACNLFIGGNSVVKCMCVCVKGVCVCVVGRWGVNETPFDSKFRFHGKF